MPNAQNNSDEEKSKRNSDLEKAILEYQSALQSNDGDLVNDAYEKICRLYDPLAYVNVWFRKYRYLFDTKEDFVQDFLRIFCTALSAWKPRHLRKQSRYNGTGDFKNFFWGALQHSYINQVKGEAAAKRSIAQRCPICEEWCNTLSTHVYERHQDLLFDKLVANGYKVDELSTCPFCKSFHVPRGLTDPLQVNQALRKHLVSKHSSLLFERFHELYPEHITVAARPISATVHDDSTDEEGQIFDSVASSASIDDLYELGLDDIMNQIVDGVLDGNLEVVYDPDRYGCTEEEFDDALTQLRSKMLICGLDGGE